MSFPRLQKAAGITYGLALGALWFGGGLLLAIGSAACEMLTEPERRA